MKQGEGEVMDIEEKKKAIAKRSQFWDKQAKEMWELDQHIVSRLYDFRARGLREALAILNEKDPSP